MSTFGFRHPQDTLVVASVLSLWVVLLSGSYWAAKKLRSNEKWGWFLKQLPKGDKGWSRKQMILFAVPLLMLSLLSILRPGRFEFLLYPYLLLYLTLPVTSGITIVLILASCLGLSLLFALGDPAVSFASTNPTIRRLLWSVLLLLFLTTPFVCLLRTVRKDLGAQAKNDSA